MTDARMIDRYIRVGMDSVDGWLSRLDAMAVASVGRAQLKLGVKGSIGEIGIHHGKLFILLAMMLEAGERGVAIDLFGEQDVNVERSGFGDEAVFKKNLTRFGIVLQQISIVRSNSLALRWESIAPEFSIAARLFSVDGGHGAEIVEHDLGHAWAGLVPAGVIIIDDYFNSEWPAVSEGVGRFMFAHQGALVPFAIGDNKLFLSRPEFARAYREQLANDIPRSRFLRENRMFGADVLILRTPHSLLDRLRQSSLVQGLRGHPAARGLQPVIRRLLKNS